MVLAKKHNLLYKAIGFGFCLLSVMALSACSTYQVTRNSEYNHPIEITESFERLELYGRPDGLELSVRDKKIVQAFIRTYSRYGDGPLYVNIPENGIGSPGVHQARSLIQEALGLANGNPYALQEGQYQTAQSAPAPVIISFRQLKTLPKNCHGVGILTATHDNSIYDGFGCSHSANFAAMIQDARQLLGPYDVSASEIGRRIEVYDKYISGENPASDQPDRQEVSSTTGS